MPKGIYERTPLNTHNHNFKKHGKEHPAWYGEKVGYNGIHSWLRLNFGKADKCENPKCLGLSKRFDWALKRGKTHERMRKNYKMLCHKCHLKYDMTPQKRNTYRQSALLRNRDKNGKFSI